MIYPFKQNPIFSPVYVPSIVAVQYRALKPIFLTPEKTQKPNNFQIKSDFGCNCKLVPFRNVQNCSLFWVF